jgi:hypothetical protein
MAKAAAPYLHPRLMAAEGRLTPDEYRLWARQQIREAFDYTPPLTIEHKADDGIDAVVDVEAVAVVDVEAVGVVDVEAVGVDVKAAAAPDANKVVPLIKNRP